MRTGTKGSSVLAVANNLVHQFPSLHELGSASLDQLVRIKGIGKDKAISLISAFTLARRLTRESLGESPLLDQPANVASFLREEMKLLSEENLYVLMLNTRNRLIRSQPVGKGTLDSLLVHPREIFRPAIQSNAASIILAHNHPSGDPSPSEADIRVTRDMIRAGKTLRIEVLDHIIIGKPSMERPNDFVSLREAGYIIP